MAAKYYNYSAQRLTGIYDDINEQKVNFLIIDVYDLKHSVYNNINLKDFTNKHLQKLLKKHQYKLILFIVYYYQKPDKKKILIEKFLSNEHMKNYKFIPKKVNLNF